MTTQFSLPLDPTLVQSVTQQTGLSVSTIGTLGPGGPVSDPAYNRANAAFTQANTGIAFTQTVYNYANTIGGGSAIDNVARVSAQSAWQLANSALPTTGGFISGHLTVGTSNTLIHSNFEVDGANDTQMTVFSNTVNNNTRVAYNLRTQANGWWVMQTGNFINDGFRIVDLTPTNYGLTPGSYERLRIDSSGNVGIGTSSPQATLDVVGTVKINGKDYDSVNSTQNNSISFLNSFSQAAFNKANTGTVLAQAAFDKANTLNSINDTLTVTSNTLGVFAGNSTADIIRANYSTGNQSILRTYGYRWADGNSWTTASTRIQQRIDVTDMAYIEFNPYNGAAGMAFGTGSNEFMRMDSGGNVGIGTNSPQSTLDVSGTVRINGRDYDAVNLTQNNNITAVNQFAQSAYNYANTISSSGNSIDSFARTTANGANGLAQSAYNKANSTISTTAGGTISSSNTVSNGLDIITVDSNTTSHLSLHATSGVSARQSKIRFYGTFNNYPTDIGERYITSIRSGFDSTQTAWGSEHLGIYVNSTTNDGNNDNVQNLVADFSNYYGLKIAGTGGNISASGAITANGTITGSSFSGAGTGLTGTAASLSIGGSAGSVANTNISGLIAPAQISPAYSQFPSGTALLFQQTSAPTGWTKQTTHNDKALRVVSGTAGSGGSVAFSAAFASQTVSGTSDATTLSTTQIPSHTHWVSSALYDDGNGSGVMNFGQDYGLWADAGSYTSTDQNRAYGRYILNSGGGGSHTHTFTSGAINLAVNYVDVIIATKN
mgnify:CR=1 FL=1